MLGVDHDKIILLSTLFPTIPMLATNCCNVNLYYVENKRSCCIVLCCKNASARFVSTYYTPELVRL